MTGPGTELARPAEEGLPAPQPWRALARELAGDRAGQVVFAATAVLAGLGYSVLLPFDYTQRVSFANWQYVGPRYAAFTAAFALGLAWVVMLQVHAVRRIARTAASAGRPRRAGPAGALAAVVSLLPSFLCCSPVVPTLVSLLGLPAATRLQTTGTITYFFAVRQDWLLAGALAVLAASGAWSARTVARAACLAQDCCPAADTGAGGARRPAVTAGSQEDHGGEQ